MAFGSCIFCPTCFQHITNQFTLKVESENNNKKISENLHRKGLKVLQGMHKDKSSISNWPNRGAVKLNVYIETLIVLCPKIFVSTYTHLASQNLFWSPGRSWFLLLLNHTSTLLSGQPVFLHRDRISAWDTKQTVQVLKHTTIHTLQFCTSYTLESSCCTCSIL